MSTWESRLADAVADGLVDTSPADVRRALLVALDSLAEPEPPQPWRADVPVLGIDGCTAGWVGVLLRPGRPASVHVSRTVAAMVEHVRETGALAVVGIDIPIGLPDTGTRVSDVLARQALPGKASSVFTTLTRAAYEAPTYAECRAAQLERTGKSASAQAYALGEKVLEVDGWLRNTARPPFVVIEVHPEVSFARMAGQPLLSKKREPAGAAERRAVLIEAGIDPPAYYRGQGFGEDDLLDACAVAWTGVRRARGESESLPPEPEVFADGSTGAITV